MNEFGTARVAELAGVNPKTLHYWDASGFLSPSVNQSQGAGSRRVYSFQDVVAARVAHELREAGISLQSLRTVLKRLRTMKGLKHPLGECFLVTDGREVFAKNGDDLVALLRQPGQRLLFHVVNLTRTVDELHREVVAMEKREAKEENRKTSRAG